MTFTAALTVTAWVQLESVGVQKFIAGKHQGTGGGFPYYLSATNGTTSDRPVLYLYNSSGVQIVGADDSLPAATWHYLTGVYDGTQLRLYRTRSGSATQSYIGGMFDSDGQFRVGQRNGDRY
jgi:hypothetical protein